MLLYGGLDLNIRVVLNKLLRVRLDTCGGAFDFEFDHTLTAVSAAPNANGMPNNGTAARARFEFSTVVAIATRTNSTVHAPMTPAASERAPLRSDLLSREKLNETAVDEMAPPINPATAYPEELRTMRRAR